MAEEQQPFNAVRFSRATKKALEFYQKGASEEDKKIVAGAIRKAAKSIKKQQRAKEGSKEKPEKKGRQQAGADQLAAGLYKVLSESGTAKVTGNPSSGAQTEIQGPVDLNQVARKLLAFAS